MKSMKNKCAKRRSPLAILAITLVFAMTAVGCDNDTTDGDGEKGGTTNGGQTFLGKTPTLSGKVYVRKENNDDTVNFEAYTGSDLTVSAENGIGQGTVKGGQFNITLGAPTSLDKLRPIFDNPMGGFFDWAGNSVDGWDLTISPSTAKGAWLDLSIADSYYGLIRENTIHNRENYIVGNTSDTYECVGYLYVDSDVTISSDEKSISGSYGNTSIYITQPFSLALRAGWNTVYYKENREKSNSTRTYTYTYSLENPNNLKWALGGGGTKGGDGGGSENRVPLSDVTPLTSGVTVSGSLSSRGSFALYSINVTSGTKYHLWWDDSDTSEGHMDVRVKGLRGYSYESYVQLQGEFFDMDLDDDLDWVNYYSFTATSTETVYIMVYPYYTTGTFAIVYNTTGNRPAW